MKSVILALFILCACLQESVAQTCLANLPCVREFQVVHEDTVSRKTHIIDNIYWIDSFYDAASQEYPVKWVVSQRSYIVSDTHKYMLDSLIIKNHNEYCLALDVFRAFLVKEERRKYLIIECNNTFQYGSDSQPIFVILSKDDDIYYLHSIYIMDVYIEEKYEKILITHDDKGIIVEGSGVSLLSFIR